MTGLSGLRIEAGVERPRAVTITVDGRAVTAAPGETVAAALLAAGIRHLGDSFRGGTPRGAFCFMGVCQECLVRIDGRQPVQACLVPVEDGMKIALGRL